MDNHDSLHSRLPWWQSRNSWVWFAFTSLFFYFHLLTTRYHELYYDSYFYWYLANSFDQAGASRFSIYNFDSALRGYLLPLLHYPAALLVRQWGGDSLSWIVKLLGACTAGALFGVACPALWEKATGQQVTSLRRLLFVGICFFLWRDYFNFVLSDFPSVLALVVALVLTYRAQHYWAAFAIGALVAFGVYARPLSLLSVPFVAALLVQQLRIRLAGQRGLAGSVSFRVVLAVLAFLLLGFPQYLINSNNYQSSSFLVLAKGDGNFKVNGEENLYLYKLNEGFGRQRYETNVGPSYTGAQATFRDPAGQALLAQSGDSMLISYPDYFGFVARHPFDMAGLYMRHLFNGLDLLYSTPYVYKIYGTTIFNSLVVYTVLFVALVLIVIRVPSLRASHWFIVGSLLITCLASMPLMVECRFFIPLHLLLYAVACFGWPARWAWKTTAPQQRIAALVAYGFFLLLCLALSSNTQAQLEQKPKTLQS